MEQTSSIVPSSHSTGKEIVTQAEAITLDNLKESDIGKAICVKVYRKWTVLNKASIPVMHCCILLDKGIVTYSKTLLHIMVNNFLIFFV